MPDIDIYPRYIHLLLVKVFFIKLISEINVSHKLFGDDTLLILLAAIQFIIYRMDLYLLDDLISYIKLY